MDELLTRFHPRINAALDRYLPSSNTPASLAAAMRYAVFNGGKRLRPTLVYLTTEILGGKLDAADRTACAVEYIHAYSLAHDDLPAMDDDDLRRGKPSCHIKFGEATAILAGDALQALAFEVIAGDTLLPAQVRIELIENLARAAGASGMVGGQQIDLDAEGTRSDAKTLANMHRCKTGQLISACLTSGAIIAGAPVAERHALEAYGFALGLAFQVKDDILDETGDPGLLGKPVGSDVANHKSTFVSLHGLPSAIRQLSDLSVQAVDALGPLGSRAATLREIARFVEHRDT